MVVSSPFLIEWANSTAIEIDWNKLNKNTSFLDSAKQQLASLAGKIEDADDGDVDSIGSGTTPYQEFRKLMMRNKEVRWSTGTAPAIRTLDNMQFYIPEAVEIRDAD